MLTTGCCGALPRQYRSRCSSSAITSDTVGWESPNRTAALTMLPLSNAACARLAARAGITRRRRIQITEKRLICGLDSGVPDQLRPLLGLGPDHAGELGRRVGNHVHAELAEVSAHLAERKHARRLAMQPVDDRRRRPG